MKQKDPDVNKRGFKKKKKKKQRNNNDGGKKRWHLIHLLKPSAAQ